MSIPFRAGHAKKDITPTYPVPLGGFGNTHQRIHDRVLDPVFAVCVAISDGENTILLYHLDLVYLTDNNVIQCKQGIEKTYGIPQKNILLNVTHTHSAPDLRSELDSMKRYTEEFHQMIIDLAGEAMADLDDARIEIGSGKVEGWNFVRRYLLSDGSYGGDNFGDFKNNTIIDHETETDRVMQLVRLVRENKKDILLVNWQGHPHRTMGLGGNKRKDLSSDVIGRFRDNVEREHDVLFSFYQGCGGNINPISRIKEEMISEEYTDIARGLADGLTPILQNKMRPVKSGPVKSVMKELVGEVNHQWDHKVPEALEVLDVWEKVSREEGTVLAEKYGFNSVYHALAVVNRSKMPATRSFEMGAVSFGDVCIAWAPCELYDTTGKFLKDTLPFEMNFICGYTNGAQFYMPTRRAFEHGGYGCDICHYPAGIAERIAWQMIEMAEEVK